MGAKDWREKYWRAVRGPVLFSLICQHKAATHLPGGLCPLSMYWGRLQLHSLCLQVHLSGLALKFREKLIPVISPALRIAHFSHF